MNVVSLFDSHYPIIGCIHLKPLPGAPDYADNLSYVYEKARKEAEMLIKGGVHGLIIENFGDAPFFKDEVPAITIACISSIAKEIKDRYKIPIGINVLRNDAVAAMAIATAVNAEFIRINIHMHAMITDQGIIEGKSYKTLRLRRSLNSQVKILADINVKHAQSLVKPNIRQWAEDLVNRGKADALIVSGSGTGKTVDEKELISLHQMNIAPIIIGSGVNTENLPELTDYSHGAIVGSYFKENGLVTNDLSPQRIKRFMNVHRRVFTKN